MPLTCHDKVINCISLSMKQCTFPYLMLNKVPNVIGFPSKINVKFIVERYAAI